MASPASAATVDRRAEPSAPVPPPTRSDSFPDAALGIVRQQTLVEDPGQEPENPPAVPVTQEPVQPITEPAPEAAPPSPEPSTEEGAPAAAQLDYDELTKNPKFQSLIDTRVAKETLRRQQEFEAKRADEIRRAEADQMRRQYQELLDKAEAGDLDAQAEVVKHANMLHLRERVEAETKPMLEANARAAIVTQLDGQYNKAYQDLGDLVDEATLAKVRHDRFDSGDVWLTTFAREVAARAVEQARVKWEKDDLAPLAEARASQRVAELRTEMPNPVSGEGTAGGLMPEGTYTTRVELDNAIASGQLSTAQGRAIAIRRGWFKPPRR